MPRSALKFFLASLFFGLFFFYFSKPSFAETTPYKTAEIITTDATGGNPYNVYTDLLNCSATDGLTCNRVLGLGYGNLYFQNFGDFGIPAGSIITAIRIRVTGKSSEVLYVGVFRGGSPSIVCQTPSDKWRMVSLFGSNIQTYEVVSSSGVDFTNCLNSTNIRSNNFFFRINYANNIQWSANIDNFEIGFEYAPIAPTPSPSPTPSPTLTPTPTPPAPFLDLPWKYEEKGLSFTEAALNINSFFDHEYPLLSTSLGEPVGTNNSVIIYEGPPRSTDNYSSHDGYDYGSLAQANFGDLVLAADGGAATFVNSCGACGNAIHIDHENGYQTRYYHLQEEGLITNVQGQSVQVDAGDQIGKVGYTGNCYVLDSNGNRIYNTPTCAHIHFMVIQDKNNDGNFEDNIPDGLVDPFGWQSTEPDPWENYEFFYKGENRVGNRSYYLWNKKIDGLNANLSANGGVFNSGRNTITFPEGATNKNLLLEIISAPIQKLSDLISSIGSTVQVNAKDTSGNQVTNFDQPLTVGISFADFDLTRFLTETLSIYSSSDGIDWIKEDTIVDLENKTATAQVDHLTYFALMAERRDTQAATTTAQLIGEEGESGHFRSDVSVALNTVDNEGGLGVDYILYRKDLGDWREYIDPIQFSNEGEYSIEFYSVDNDENVEEPKSVAFSIDKTTPEAEIKFNPATLDLDIVGIDSSGSAVVNISDLPKNKNSIKITDQAGNVLEIIGKYKEKGRSARAIIESLRYNQEPAIDKNSTKLNINYNLDNQSSDLRRLEQEFEIEGELKIRLKYLAETDVTRVITKVKGQEKVKEELAGIRILQLRTENATLNYSY